MVCQKYAQLSISQLDPCEKYVTPCRTLAIRPVSKDEYQTIACGRGTLHYYGVLCSSALSSGFINFERLEVPP